MLVISKKPPSQCSVCQDAHFHIAKWLLRWAWVRRQKRKHLFQFAIGWQYLHGIIMTPCLGGVCQRQIKHINKDSPFSAVLKCATCDIGAIFSLTISFIVDFPRYISWSILIPSVVVHCVIAFITLSWRVSVFLVSQNLRQMCWSANISSVAVHTLIIDN